MPFAVGVRSFVRMGEEAGFASLFPVALGYVYMSHALLRPRLLSFVPFNSINGNPVRLAAWCGLLAAALCGLGDSCASAQSKLSNATAIALSSASGAVTTVTSGTVVTLTATVTSASTALTTGQVNFCDASAKTCTDIHLLGTVQLTSAGTATLKIRPGIGTHSYKAVFAGTKTYASSASGASALTATGTIPPLATRTSIDQTGGWGAYTLSATVTETGNPAPPTGTVSFLDTNHGNAVLGTGTLGAATRDVAWTTANSSVPNIAAVSYAVADLNGDGIPDVFIKDYFGTYDVALGKADGTFTTGATAFGPYSQTGPLVLGDFNNDGIVDVAAVNAVFYASNNTITIFLGHGDGTFTVAASSPAIGMNPAAITTADINGDGNADLVVSQQVSSNGEVVVLFGNGDGTFTQASSTTSTASPGVGILPADLNGDGNIDLVLCGVGPTGNTILLGNGDGTFTVSSGPGQSGQALAAVADVNGDGIPDLVFSAVTTSYLTVFLGNGDGTFTQAPSSPNAAVKMGSFSIGDFNQDGIPDIVYAIFPNSTSVGVLFGKGDGSFVPSIATFPVPLYFNNTLGVGDFNGDGWPDVLFVDGSGRAVVDSLNQPTETATASATAAIGLPGTHLADASYSGDPNFNPSVSGTLSLWGAPPATATSLTVVRRKRGVIREPRHRGDAHGNGACRREPAHGRPGELLRCVCERLLRYPPARKRRSFQQWGGRVQVHSRTRNAQLQSRACREWLRNQQFVRSRIADRRSCSTGGVLRHNFDL